MLRRIIYGIWKRPRDPRPFTLPRSKGDLHPSRGSGKSSLRMHGCRIAHCRLTCSSLAAGVKPACQHHNIFQVCYGVSRYEQVGEGDSDLARTLRRVLLGV